MTERTYCSSCGALLQPAAVFCGECGAPVGTSVWDGRKGAAPGAWGGPRGTRDEPAPAAPELGDEEPIERLTPAYGGPPPVAGGLPDDRTGIRPQPVAPAAPPAEPQDQGPGAVELEPPLDGAVVAPYGRRVLATVLDAVLWGLVTAPLTIGLVLSLLAASRGDGAGALALALLFVGAVLVVVYLAGLVVLQGTRAVSPGKKITGLRLVGRRTGTPLGILPVIGRYLVFAVPSAIPVLGLVMPLSPLFDGTRRRQGLHDKVVDAILVDVASGRNPLKPRIDSFDRAPDSAFLPAGPQRVDVDTRMRVEPGAPWASPASAPDRDGAEQSAAEPGQSDEAPAASPAASPEASPWAPVPPRGAPVPPPASSHAPEPSEDLESTRVFRRPVPSVRARLHLDDGRELTLAGRTLVGRNPAADSGEEVSHLLSVSDPGRSLSKTHLQIDVGDDGVTATDRFSTNGTVLADADGRRALTPGAAIAVPPGGVLVVGDRELRVEWERG